MARLRVRVRVGVPATVTAMVPAAVTTITVNIAVVWAAGGTYKWEHGGGGYGAGALDAGVLFRGRWMMAQREIYASGGN